MIQEWRHRERVLGDLKSLLRVASIGALMPSAVKLAHTRFAEYSQADYVVTDGVSAPATPMPEDCGARWVGAPPPPSLSLGRYLCVRMDAWTLRKFIHASV